MRTALTTLLTVAFLLLIAERGLCESPKPIEVKAAEFQNPVDGAQSRAQSCPDPEGCDPGPSPYKCYDSDAQRTWETGTVSFWYYDMLTVYTDYCSSSTTMVEYWCTINKTVNSTTYYCFDGGCSGGRCL